MDRQCSSCGGFCRKSGCERENVVPVPQREWQGLTDEEMAAAWSQSKGDVLYRLKPFARAIEAKLRERNST